MAATVAIAGLGAMGGQVALELAGRGVRVLGFDRFRPPHALGSSHGRTRIIRQAYFEHPQYVPLVLRAYERWAELERRAGERLLLTTGGLMLGDPDSDVVAGSLRSAREHGLEHEALDARDVRRRFPAFALPDGQAGVWEPAAGVLAAERAVEAALGLARAAGADLRPGEAVVAWEPRGEGLEVRTTAGRHLADALVVAAGAWCEQLVPELAGALKVTRQPVFWLAPRSRRERFAPDRFPVFVWQPGRGRYVYGLPDLGDGVKIGLHDPGDTVSPDDVDREAGDRDLDPVRAVLARHLPDADGAVRDSAVCLYTRTPDGHFVLDRLPDDARVVVASPCSGHGFKFAPVVGEVAADLATGRDPAFDLEPFRMARLEQRAAPLPPLPA